MFGFGRKKKPSAPNEQKERPIPAPSSGLKNSLLSLEQRLMFDAAASATASEVASEQVAQEQAEAAVSGEASSDAVGGESGGGEDVVHALATYMPSEGYLDLFADDATVVDDQGTFEGQGSVTEPDSALVDNEGMNWAGILGNDYFSEGSLMESLGTDGGGSAYASDGEVGESSEPASLPNVTDPVPQESTGSSQGSAGAGHGEAEEGLPAVTTDIQSAQPVEIAFIDPTVPNYHELLSSMDPNIEVILLDGGQDGIEQMAAALSGRTGIDAIHIISHGGTGELQLGTGTLNRETMSGQYADELAAIKQALSEQADLLVYGCEFAEGDVGMEAVNQLAALTGADVAASDDLTGNADLDGDWVLEQRVGTVETAVLAFDAYRGVLGLDHTGQWTVTGDTASSTSTASASTTVGGVTTTVSFSNFSTSTTSVSNFATTGTGATLNDIGAFSDSVQNSASVGMQFNWDTNPESGTSLAATDAGTARMTITFSQAVKDPIIHLDRIGGAGGIQNGMQLTLVDNGVSLTRLAGTSHFRVDGNVIDNSQAGVANSVAWGFGAESSTNTTTGTSAGSVQINGTVTSVTFQMAISANANVTEGLGGDAFELKLSFDAPPDANADTFTVNEDATLSGNLFANNGAGADRDSTGDAFTVTKINGASFTVGTPITLATGTLTVTNAATGDFTFAPNANYTGPASFTYTIADASGGTDNAIVNISVNAVNDAPLDITLKGSTVAENAVKGTVVGTAAGSDADAGDKLTYSLTDTAGGRFAINSTTGEITVADGSLLNAEASSSHKLTVRVTDAGGLSVDKTFSINVSNVNEAPLLDLDQDDSSGVKGSDYQTVFTENGSPVGLADVDLIVSAGDSSVLANVQIKLDGFTDVHAERLNLGGVDLEIGTAFSGAVEINGQKLTIDYDGGGYIQVSNPDGKLAVETVQHLLAKSTYEHTSETPTEGDRQVYIWGNDGLVDSNLVVSTITVQATNDAPTDLSLSANTVAENATTGTVVGTVSGTDRDAGDTKTYSLTDTAGGRFAINASTGVITVADGSLLNYESAASHTVTVRVTDSGGQSYTEQFTINLTNVNEGPTDLSLSANSVAEHATTGTVVGTVTGTDPDASDTKTYSLTDTAGGRFAINASTGVITVADGSLLNYEAAASHNLTVQVTDSGGQSYTEQFTINLTNVNEGPTDLSLSANSVAEHATTGTVVGTVTGTDPDASDTKTYSLTDTAGGRFAINASTGVITVADGSLLNYEAAASHNLTVQVTDSGGQSYTEQFTINLTNVNEGPTDLSLSANSVAENATTGTVVGTVTGTDPDASDTKTYSLTDTAGGRFAINASTGVITVADGSLLDYEAAASHSVTVQVTDSGGQSYTESFTINLTNVNEGPTDLSLSANSVAENATTGTVVGTVTGTDPDAGDTKTYSLTDTAGGRFAINASTGVITVADGSLLNYEAAASHNLTVQVTDSGGQSYTEQFTINLTNVNEGPTDLALSANSVAENATTGTVVGTVTGTDPDAGDTKTYSLTDTAGGRFAINASTGVITVADGSLLNYESAACHNLTVQVTDSGGQSYTEQFTINLTNVNEGPTDLALSANSVAENASTGTVVGTVSSTDPDAGETKTYSLTDTAGGRFAIDPTTGVITVADGSLLNYESAASHNLTVQVTDSGGQSYTEQFTINLTNVNEGPTDLALSANSVAENASTGTVVGTVSSTDPDAGETKTYSLTDTAGGRFAIDPTTGVITVADGSLLNYESAASHNLTVQVTDSGGQSYTEQFTINLTNVNEGPTDLALSANSVAENASTGTVVGTVSSTDPDAGETKTYSLTDTAGGRFAINASTGVITVADGSLLNYEAAASHNLTVQVTDSGGQSYTESFTINLTNVNEGPTDLSLSANSVAENATTGTVVGTVSSTDPDAGETKTYSLTDTAGGRFAINASTGVITVADGSLLNYESASSHTVTVRVTDGAGQSCTENFTINLTNVNEGPSGADATITLSEDTAHTLTTANFGFSDVDAGDTLSAVRMDTLPTAGTLTLSGVTVTAGQVVTAADITAGRLVFSPAADANGTGYASLTFSVQDSYSTYDAAPNTLTFNVTAVNDAPVDLSLSANTVAENATTGTVVGMVSGTDPDAGDTKTYSLTDTAGGRFAINASTGVITVADGSLLNYESAASHTVTVRVTDSGGQSYTETFTINLTNVNEGPTDLALSANSVAENASTGTVVGTVSGTDPDASDTKTYSLMDTAGGRFAINASTGVITVADGSGLNYEGATSHSIIVRVTDAGGQSYDKTFTIGVTNVNEGPTDLSLSANSVVENATTGTVVGTITGTDPDAGDTKTYSLTDTAGGRFAIDTATGQLTVADGSLLNYESASSHTVTVRVTDSAGQSYTESFTINLTNVNEASTEVDGGDGGEQTLVASLFQKSPAGPETVQPFILSQTIGGDSESKSGSVDDFRKPVEWDAQPVPTVDVLDSGRNVLAQALGGDENHVGGAGTKGNVSTSLGQQDEMTGDLESTNSAPSDPRQVSWPSVEATELVGDDSEGVAKTMVAGLVGSALQGSMRKKERMTTLHGELRTGDQEAANEQTSPEHSSDEKEAPPNAA